MTEPQAWVLIGVFAAVMLSFAGGVIAMIGQQSKHFGDRIDQQTKHFGDTIDGMRDVILATVDARFTKLDARIDSLDKDVQAIAVRVFPERDT